MQPLQNGTLLAFLAATVGACASSQVTDTWKSPEVKTIAMRKVLTVAYVPTESVRRNLEDRLVRELGKEGVAGVTSYRVVEDVDSLDKESIRTLMRENQFDAVLIANYLGTTTEVEYIPTTTYYGYFGAWGTPPMVDETTEVHLEFRLFDGRGEGRLVWSATTSTFEPTSDSVPEVAEKVVERLEDDREG